MFEKQYGKDDWLQITVAGYHETGTLFIHIENIA